MLFGTANMLVGAGMGVLFAIGVILLANILVYGLNKSKKPSPMEIFLENKIKQVDELIKEKTAMSKQLADCIDTLEPMLLAAIPNGDKLPDDELEASVKRVSSTPSGFIPYQFNDLRAALNAQIIPHSQSSLSTGSPASSTRHSH